MGHKRSKNVMTYYMDGPPAYDREIEAAEAIIEDQDQRIDELEQ